MKKLLSMLLFGISAILLTVCGNGDNMPQERTVSVSAPQQEKGGQKKMKALIVYFSWSGKTEAVAREIEQRTGADVFRLMPEKPYSEDYDTVLDVAKSERQNLARPVFVGKIDNLEQYDVIFLGFPNWWSDMPMILYTFLETYSLNGKTIAPFCTSGGSGFSNTLRDIRSLQPGVTVTEGLHIGSASAANSGNAVGKWLSDIGLAK